MLSGKLVLAEPKSELTPRPSAVAGRTVFAYSGENSGIPVGNAPGILDNLPFRFTGTINKLTFNLGPSQLTAADQKATAEAIAKAKD